MTAHPHQLALGAMLDKGVETNAICWGRRNGKTEAVWMWLLGLLDSEPDTFVVMTAQTAVKARERFMAHARRLDRHYPEDAGGPKIRKGAVVDMDFQNGSRLWVVAPDEDSFRGDEARVVFFDEAQSYDKERGESLKQGAMPLLDSVDDGQIILAGTPGNVRAGWFWDALNLGAKEEPGHVSSWLSAGDDIAAVDLDDEDVWRSVLPGIGTITTLDKMRARRAGLSDPAWAQEYLGIWPKVLGETAISAEAWENTCLAADGFPELPDAFALALSVLPPNDAASSLTAAYRDADGHGYVTTLHHQGGTAGLARVAGEILTKYPRVRLVYDGIGANNEPIKVLERDTRLRSRVHKVTSGDVQAGQAALVRELHEGTVFHREGQSGMDTAAESLRWNEAADKGRWFGFKKSGADISPLSGAALALWDIDQNVPRKTITKVHKA
ncbi:hypothetical protein ACFO6V_28015 [Promicromonospora alba]|uniref:Phage terminase large subunit-like protein n=1 Tax=Promicromonospora alba TaxID=1616110 RepID=A0ABV9HT27_9MICO